jgi:hypothetical protein
MKKFNKYYWIVVFKDNKLDVQITGDNTMVCPYFWTTKRAAKKWGKDCSQPTRVLKVEIKVVE